MSLVDWVNKCIETCKTSAEINTQNKAEVLLQKFAEKLDADGVSGGAIQRIESTDTENPVVLRSLDSGTYVLHGKFKPYAGADSTMTFSSALLVNVIKRTSDTQVQVFYPVNNVVQHLTITDSEYTRKDVNLNDLSST